MRLTLIQLEIRDGDTAGNLERAQALIRSAPPSDLVLLPELFTTGYAHAGWRSVAAGHTAVAVHRMQALARERKTAIAGSLVSLNAAQELVNRLWLALPDGRLSHYDKCHLYAPMREAELLSPGANALQEEISGMKVMFSICFDLRFPGMYRKAALAGANLLCLVSEWPSPRAEVLRLLTRARAAENHAFAAVCNRVGMAADGTMFTGGSAIVGPEGSVITEASDGRDAIITAELDPAACDKLRQAIGTFACRNAASDVGPT